MRPDTKALGYLQLGFEVDRNIGKKQTSASEKFDGYCLLNVGEYGSNEVNNLRFGHL